MLLSPLSVLLVSYGVAVHGAAITNAFPMIDLGYARHIPTKINYTTLNNISYATYANIRFAQPPLGDLRFRAPQTPPPVSEKIQDGVVPLNSTNCVQSVPTYFDIAGVGGATWGSEDCLFLDVIVPDGVRAGDNVPVLHWIYGGGFFFGAKDTGGNPASLLDDMSTDQKFVVVASNYRLGALGWMSSDEEPSMVKNAGLYDAWAALEWTQDNIHRFGGDANKVTVMGQSAGASIIQHFLAANSVGRYVPFSQAILSSPGTRPHVNRSTEMTDLWHQFLNQTNCTNLACVRAAKTDTIVAANRWFFNDAPSGGFPGLNISFTPILDNNLVKDVPLRVLENNSVNMSTSNVRRVITGNLINEGAASTIGTFKSWYEQLLIFMRTPTQSTIREIENLYGPFNGSRTSFPTNTTIDLTPFDKFSGDLIFRCNGQATAKMYSSQGGQNRYWQAHSLSSSSYRYDVSIPPATHGDDLNYYFFDPVIAAVMPSLNVTIAKQFQSYLRRFILGEDLQNWPEYGSTGLNTPSYMNISVVGFQPVVGGGEVDLGMKCSDIVSLISNPNDGW